MNKPKLLPAAIAGILGAAAFSAAYAVTAPDSVDTTLFIGGATATDVALRSVILRQGGICQDGTIDVYQDGASPGAGKNIAIICTLGTAVGTLTAGTNVAFVKESNGGSDRGTAYVSQSTSLAFRDPFTHNCDATSTAVSASTSPLVGNKAYTAHYNCTGGASPTSTAGNVTSVAPDAGIADVDPRLFNVGTETVSDTDINALDTQPLYQPMFTVPVSLNLYRALQRAQGKSLTDLEADIPTLTSGQIRGAFAFGGLNSWAQITSATGLPINHPSLTGGVTVSNTMYVCRRGDESGTQAGTAQYFLNERCGTATQTFKAPTNTVPNTLGMPSGAATKQKGEIWVTLTTTSSTSTASRVVFAGAGSGDVRNCLDGHNDLDQFAIGMLSSESTYDTVGGNGGSASSTPGSQFRYVAIDGQKPTLVEVANGRYDFVMENVWNRRISPALSAGKDSLADSILSAFANPTIVASTLIQKANAHGYTGGLLPKLTTAVHGGVPATTSTITSNPVSAYLKSTGSGVNNCNYPINLVAAPTN
jgi:hypothetical protein